MEEEFENVWDDITISVPCISWEICECLYSQLVVWEKKKPARVFPLCVECGLSTYTTVVWATFN